MSARKRKREPLKKIASDDDDAPDSFESDEGSSNEYLDTDGDDDNELDSDDNDDNVPMSAARRTDGSSNRKRTKIRKQNPYKPPSNKEIYQLKETENLFQSSLFKMQITEMLSEITLKETRRKYIEMAVNQLKNSIKELSKGKQHELDDCSWLKKVHVPLFDTGRPICGKFKFLPPSQLYIIGSFGLHTCVKPDIHVDLVLEMPKESFQKQDYLNHRYFKKRALYLSSIARKLQINNSDFIEDMKFTYHHGNHLKPTLVISVKGRGKKPVKVHIHAVPEAGTFKLNRFSLSKNNIRKRWFDQSVEAETEETDTPNFIPTPFYNNSVLHDLTAVKNTEFLNNMLSGSQALQKGLCLLKVWLHQRELYNGFGGFSGYIMSMYMAYLLIKKKLNKMMSSHQVMRTTLICLSEANWTEEDITLCVDTTEDQHRPTLADFHQKFSVVFVDVTGYTNLCYAMSKSVFLRVKHEAQLAVDILQNRMLDNFDVLFMTNVPFQRKFDTIIQIPVQTLEKCVKRIDVEDKFMDMGGNYVHSTLPHIMNLLTSSLGDRLHLIQCQVDPPPEWPINEDPPGFNCFQTVAFGLLLNIENASSIIDRGPPADSPEAKEFREFWGEKSEIRRFKDGSICEAVVWDKATTIAKRRSVCSSIIKHVLERHASIDKESVTSTDNLLDPLLTIPLSKHNKTLVYGTGEEQHFAIMKAFDELSRILRSFTDLPLSINSVQGNCPVFRFTEVFPPMVTFRNPKVKPTVKKEVSLPVERTFCPVWTPALKVICLLEGSGSWPEDKEAIRRLKAAFNIKMTECLEKQGLMVETKQDHVDVVKDGLVFRLVLCYAREIAVLKMVKSPDGLLKMIDTEESYKLEREIKVLPKLTSTLFGLQQTFNTFSCVARLVKRWVSGHMLLDYIEEEALELIIAHLYLHPEPFTPPGSPVVGFLRFLQLLSSFDWKISPLIVNLNNEFKDEDIVEIKTKFSKDRADLPIMFISTPPDRYSSYVTKGKPSAQILHRLVLLAKESLNVLPQQLAALSLDTDYRVVFRPQLDVYDVLLHLKKNQLNKHHLAIDIPKIAHVPSYATDNKYDLPSFPVTEYEPVQYYLRELRDVYDDIALFFFDNYGGSVIAVVWKPQAFVPKQFKVSDLNYTMPTIQSTEKNQEEIQLRPNVEAILEDFKILGGGLVNKVEAKTDKWTI